MKRSYLGELLVARKVVSAEQLKIALAQHRRWGRPLGRTLVALGYCSDLDVLAALSQQTGIPAVDLDAEPMNPQLQELLPRSLAERFAAVPLRRCGPGNQVLVVAIAAPGSLNALDAIRRHTGLRVSPVLAGDDAIHRAHGRLYAEDDAFAWPGGPLRPLQERMFDLDWAG